MHLQGFNKPEAETRVKLDILFIIEELGDGGQERQLYYLATMLSKTHKIGILPFRFNPDDKYFRIMDGNILLTIFQLKSMRKLAKVREIRTLIRESKPAVVHSFCFHLNFATWLVSVGTETLAFGGIRSRLQWNHENSGAFGFYTSMLFPRRKISNNYLFLDGLAAFPKILYRLFSKTYCIHNGLPINTFRYNKPDFIKETGMVKSGSISRLYGEKRIDLLIDLIYRLKQRGVSIRHKHAGAGPLLDSMKERIRTYNLDENFIFVGEAGNISEFFSDCHVFIHTAEIEGCPNVTMEAMACGKPILTTNCGDTSLLVRHGVNGYVAGVNNLMELEQYAMEMFSDEVKLKEMGKQSRLIAEQTFGLSLLMDKTLMVYRENGRGM
ncbi:MAG: glycosyltransferase [Saprospiraceae bacterium]|nr:glycosyltransferase [Saprospiraceae bacterium]